MSDPYYGGVSSGSTSSGKKHRQSDRKVNRKRIGVIRKNGKTGKKENFLDIYVDWPIRNEGEFEFTNGKNLAPFSSVSTYKLDQSNIWKFELNGAIVLLDALLSGAAGHGRFIGGAYDMYSVTWKVEHSYRKGD